MEDIQQTKRFILVLHGHGVEAFSKLHDSIYFHDCDRGVFLNLFIASKLRWAKRNFVLRQETAFPESDTTQLTVQESTGEAMAIHLRIPFWAGNTASVQVNGEAVGVVPSASSYYTLSRQWKKGDRITLRLPMKLRMETLPDNPTIAALLYGPLVLAGAIRFTGEWPECPSGMDRPHRAPGGTRQ